MATTAKIAKTRKKPKFDGPPPQPLPASAAGRAAIYRKFGLCRICFRRSGAAGLSARRDQGELVRQENDNEHDRSDRGPADADPQRPPGQARPPGRAGLELKLEVCRILKEEGFIKNFRRDRGRARATLLRIFLRYNARGHAGDQPLQRVSKPGRRVYRGADEIQPVLQRPRAGHRLDVAGPAHRPPGARAPGGRRGPLRGLVGGGDHVAHRKNADPDPQRESRSQIEDGVVHRRGPEGQGVAAALRRLSRSRSRTAQVTVARTGDDRSGARASTA